MLTALLSRFRQRPFAVAARSALLLDFASGEVLYEQDPDETYAPASITKLMTLRIAYEALHAGVIRLHERVPIRQSAAASNPAFQDASLMFLEPGDKVTVLQLMQGMAVPSGSDAAVAMAEHLAGSVPAFVYLMNLEARRMGMTQTRFVDPHGLSGENRTTARDLAVLARRYLRDAPESLAQLHSLTRFRYGGVTFRNTNLLPGSYPGADGLKTGFLDSVGYNQISTVRRGDRRLIGIVMGTASKKARRNQSAALMDYGFSVCAVRTGDPGLRGNMSSLRLYRS